MDRDLQTFAKRGPFAVGVATIEVAVPEEPGRRLTTDVWYPAAEDRGTPADHPFARPHAARIDAPPIDEPAPLIVFSHGNSGLRRQSTFLTTHLASWGAVVAAPDHAGNTAFEMAAITDEEARKSIHLQARRQRPRDLAAVLDTVAAGSPAWPRIDAARIGSLGHSFGGWTAIKMPRIDPRVRAVCGLAPTAEPFVGRRAFEPDELPFADARPVLIIAGLSDGSVEFDATIRSLFRRMAHPRGLVGLESCDHFHFCDGIELLQGLSVARADPRRKTPARPYADLLPEERAHALLCGAVAAFFTDAFAGVPDPCARLDGDALRALDPAGFRLDPLDEQPEVAVS